ncbi:hypothetical protein [Prevotella pallens]|jgi:hypothetical protein|uniref:hypothetical protein n=1 Tax=Prevotella pallens TaxID=60133 RepID=UPI001CAFC2BA|nr:hypothetical protein [Prevotella pallens]MBF1498011.1 hypothetical protein [Prevotella pallens]
MKKNDFKMLESIGSVLSKDELRAIVGGGENLKLRPKEGSPVKRIMNDCENKREGQACTGGDLDDPIIGVCKSSPYNNELECRPNSVG